MSYSYGPPEGGYGQPPHPGYGQSGYQQQPGYLQQGGFIQIAIPSSEGAPVYGSSSGGMGGYPGQPAHIAFDSVGGPPSIVSYGAPQAPLPVMSPSYLPGQPQYQSPTPAYGSAPDYNPPTQGGGDDSAPTDTRRIQSTPAQQPQPTYS